MKIIGYSIITILVTYLIFTFITNIPNPLLWPQEIKVFESIILSSLYILASIGFFTKDVPIYPNGFKQLPINQKPDFYPVGQKPKQEPGLFTPDKPHIRHKYYFPGSGRMVNNTYQPQRRNARGKVMTDNPPPEVLPPTPPPTRVINENSIYTCDYYKKFLKEHNSTKT